MSDQVETELKRCDRCDMVRPLDDFRGDVCGWCAEDLDRAVTRLHEGPPDENQEPLW